MYIVRHLVRQRQILRPSTNCIKLHNNVGSFVKGKSPCERPVTKAKANKPFGAGIIF